MNSKFMSKPILILLFLMLIVISLFPLLFMVSSSLKEGKELLSGDPTLLPKDIDLSNYKFLFNPPIDNPYTRAVEGFPRMILNTILYAVITTLISLPLAIMAAYALARQKLSGKSIFIMIILFCYLLPRVAVLVPTFQFLVNIGLHDTFSGLVLVYQIIGLPLSIWMLTGYFKNVPKELEEAAVIDGCTTFMSIIKIFLPVSAPGIAAVATFNIIVVWQEFMFNLVLTKSDLLRNVQVGMQYFFQFGLPVDWGLVMAASTVIALPMAILFSYMQQFLISGLLAGAVKG